MIWRGYHGQRCIIKVNNPSPHRLLDSFLFFMAELIKVYLTSGLDNVSDKGSHQF